MGAMDSGLRMQEGNNAVMVPQIIVEGIDGGRRGSTSSITSLDAYKSAFSNASAKDLDGLQQGLRRLYLSASRNIRSYQQDRGRSWLDIKFLTNSKEGKYTEKRTL